MISLEIGPQVAFVDDVLAQVEPLRNAFERRFNTGTVVFDASPDRNVFPAEPLSTVRVLFLDLYYSDSFDPYMSAQWVLKIVPKNVIYALVVWSKDTDKTSELLQVLGELDMVPSYLKSWQKTDFNLHTHDFSSEVSRLISDVSGPQESSELIYGQILDWEEDGVLVNCMLDLDKPTFQVRRFDSELFSDVKNRQCVFVKICISTRGGMRKIEIQEESKDLSSRFNAIDYFVGLEGSAFFEEG